MNKPPKSKNMTNDSEFCPVRAGQLFTRAKQFVEPEVDAEENPAEEMSFDDASEIYRAAVETERRAAAKLAQAQKAYIDAQTLADEAAELVLDIAERRGSRKRC